MVGTVAFKFEQPLFFSEFVRTNVCTDPSDVIKRKIMGFESVLQSIGCDGIDLPLKHYFADGVYVRELGIPAGVIATGRIHLKSTVNVVLKGDITVYNTATNEAKRFKSGEVFVTPAGNKKIVYTHADTVFMTVHGCDEEDPEAALESLTVGTFSDLERLIQEGRWAEVLT